MNVEHELKEARKTIIFLLGDIAVCGVIIVAALARAWVSLDSGDFVLAGVVLGCAIVPVRWIVDSLERVLVIRRLSNELKTLAERDKE